MRGLKSSRRSRFDFVWVVTPGSDVVGDNRLGGPGGSMVFRHDGPLPRHYPASQPRITETKNVNLLHAFVSFTDPIKAKFLKGKDDRFGKWLNFSPFLGFLQMNSQNHSIYC
jgi:hypothetical protein